MARTSINQLIRVDQQLTMIPKGYKPRNHSATDGARPTRRNRSSSYPVDLWRLSPYVSPNSGSHSPKDRRNRRNWRWPGMPSFNIPHFNLPAGFHPPDTAMIKRLLYIGIVVLSFVLSAMGAMRSYSQMYRGDSYNRYTRFIPEREIENDFQRRKAQLEYERTPWDRPEVQKRMMKYLDDNYGEHRSWLFPYQDTYITFPPDTKYELDPQRRRKIKRKHFDMLTEILRRQAYKDNPGVSLYPNIDRVKLLPDIPGLDDSFEQRYIWDYASDPIKRMNFRYWGFDKPTYDDLDN